MVITEALPHSDGLHHPTWLPTQSKFLSILHQRGTTHGHLAIRAKADKVPVPAAARSTSLDSQSSLRTASLPPALLANPSPDHQRERLKLQI